MSFIRITEPGVGAVEIPDLGITLAISAVSVLSDQFNVADLYLSADLEALIIAGTLDIEIDFGTGYTSVAAGDYTNRDTLGAFLNVYEITNEDNNEDLVDGSEVNVSGPGATPLHIHDLRYYTQAELGDSTAPGVGGDLIGVDDTACVAGGSAPFNTLQEALEVLCSAIGAVDLDGAYDNDSDGRLDVDTPAKPLDFRSDNSNDISITRTDTVDIQDILRANVGGDELCLGALVEGGLAQFDVRVKSDLIVDGDITFTGTITDTTVNNMNVTNAEIRLREGAVVGGDAALLVERGATGADACVSWNETIDRWEVGIVGTKFIIATIDDDEDVTGVWCFGGADDTEPNICMIEKDDTAPPTVNLGAAGEIPMAMFENGMLAIYDKSNGRNKWLSVQRQFMYFTGRDNGANKDEYARTVGAFTSNQTGIRLMRKATLIGISIQTNGVETWTAEVRKNSVAAVEASLAAAAASGNQTSALDVDFAQGDEIQVFLNTAATNVDRPSIVLEFAYLFAA